MKFLFIVQGEGRGHMTQAIALYEILSRNGHEVCSTLIGKSNQREIPEFFYKNIKTAIIEFNSPNFIKDRKNKKIKIFYSFLYNFLRSGLYFKSIIKINKIVKNTNPDAIINFNDLIGGLYSFFYKPEIPFYCVGHQYYFYHSNFAFPKGYIFQRILLFLHTKITSLRAEKKLALSFYDLPGIPEKRIFITPPLLRKEILISEITDESYILGYILNDGYSEEIIKWQKQNPGIELHVFWDKKNAEIVTKINNNLTFHKLDDTKYINYLKNCMGVISSAGFESVCEAMFLGKPVLISPNKNHYEQECNAVDAIKAGAAIIERKFNINKLINFFKNYNKNNEFVNWVLKAEKIFIEHLTNDKKLE
ncbi:MAG: glycosyltransferase [Bacteroidales bacterium]|nr:glycosyltransferase [Bacteroidales bacterium]